MNKKNKIIINRPLLVSTLPASWKRMSYKSLLLSTLIFYPLLTAAIAEKTQENGIYTGNSKLTVDNINKTTELLRDPSVATRNLRRETNTMLGAAKNKVQATVNELDQLGYDPDQEEPETMKDPTEMSSSFRATMNKMTVRQTTKITTTGAPTKLPEISLAAIVYGDDKSYYAMLHIDDRTVLIREGDKATFVDNSQVIDLIVQSITKNDVRIAVQPSNQLIVLR